MGVPPMFEGREIPADYNPLGLLSNLGNEQKASTTAAENDALPLEEKLQRHVIDGDKQKLIEHLDQAREKYKPLDIINDHLLAGMKVVGELFGTGQMQLPFVLQSAEVMKAAVAHLEKFMEKADGQSRGKLVLATVKGDVHDIGKNLVDIILSNNGFTVYNIGIKQPIDNIIAKAAEVGADAVGLSGLLVKSTLVMKDDLTELNRRNLSFPTMILGGAALTRKYVEHDLRSLYRGPLFFGKDAFEGLRVMDAICTGKTKEMLMHTGVEELRAAHFCGGGLPSTPGATATIEVLDAPKGPSTSDFAISDIARDLPISPVPPFFGTRVVQEIPVEQLFPYVDEVALFRGQWQFKTGNKTRDDFREWTEETVRPIYDRIKEKVRELRVLHPAVVYGYFPVRADKNDLIVYEIDPQGRPTEKEKLRFHFPRQPDKKRWCLSDFFRPRPSDSSLLTSDFPFDVAAFTCVTMGSDMSIYENKLREAGDYTEYLYMHGIGVQMAEALAEFWHKRVRQELGIAIHDPPDHARTLLLPLPRLPLLLRLPRLSGAGGRNQTLRAIKARTHRLRAHRKLFHHPRTIHQRPHNVPPPGQIFQRRINSLESIMNAHARMIFGACIIILIAGTSVFIVTRNNAYDTSLDLSQSAESPSTRSQRDKQIFDATAYGAKPAALALANPDYSRSV